MFKRYRKNKLYKVISKDDFGLVLAVPRYQKTDVRIGTKKEAVAKGLNPRGRENFYELPDGTVVVDGFLAEPSKENKVEIRVKGRVVLSKENWEEIKREIEALFDFAE